MKKVNEATKVNKLMESAAKNIFEEESSDTGRLEGLKAFSNNFKATARISYWLNTITKDLDKLSKCKTYKDADNMISTIILDFKLFNDSVKSDYDACVTVQKDMKR